LLPQRCRLEDEQIVIRFPLGAVQHPDRLLAIDDVLAVITLSAREIFVIEGFARSFIAHSYDIDIRVAALAAA
jgi:hypothetical protein